MHVVRGDCEVGGEPDGIVVRVGLVQGTSCHVRSAAQAQRLISPRDQWDPLAVRLGLMCSPYHLGADVTEPMLTWATKTIRRWRRMVAEWAESPSRAIPASTLETVNNAMNRLDVVSAITVLRDLAADEALPPGAKFETFVYADRVLALELARDIGQPRA